MATKIILLESREEIPIDLLCHWITKQEGRKKTSQDITHRSREVSPRNLDPRENREPFGTSKSLKKHAIQERMKQETWQQERIQPRWLVDQTEENPQHLTRNGQWNKNSWQLWSLLQKISDIKCRKGYSQERSGVLKFSLNGQGVWNKSCKTKQTIWSEARHARGWV